MDLLTQMAGRSEQIAKRPIRDQIREKLAYMINHGLLRPGDELPSERRIAETLGVSRETVRAALALLRDHGMISISHGSLSVVIGPSTSMPPPLPDTPTQIMARGSTPEQVYEARTAIEAEVMRLVTQRIGDATIGRLRDLLKEQERLVRDPVGFQMSDVEFHMTLYEACGNPLLFNYAAELYSFPLDVRRQALLRKGATARAVLDHRTIVDAVAARDAELAVQAMGSHLDRDHVTALEVTA